MPRIFDVFKPNPDYLGNNITFGELALDEQIENLKVFHARQLADLERDYELNRAELEDKYAQEMQTLLERKAKQERIDKCHSALTMLRDLLC